MILPFVFSLLASTVAMNCQSGWYLQDDRCFYFGHDEMNWNDARNICKRYGGDLASLLTRYDEEFLMTYVNKYNGHFWIGGNYLGGIWVWAHSGSPITEYVHWHSSQPNSIIGYENCLEIDSSNDGWHDYGCMTEMKYICEMKPL